jgi:hypothetical protein
MRFEVVLDVQRPRTEVFHRMVEELPIMLPNICALTEEVHMEGDQEMGVGARGQIRIRTSLLTTTLVDFEVKQCVENVLMSMECRRRNRVALGEYRFSDTAEGTKVRMITAAQGAGPRWMQDWRRHALQRHEERDGRRLMGGLIGLVLAIRTTS